MRQNRLYNQIFNQKNQLKDVDEDINQAVTTYTKQVLEKFLELAKYIQVRCQDNSYNTDHLIQSQYDNFNIEKVAEILQKSEQNNKYLYELSQITSKFSLLTQPYNYSYYSNDDSRITISFIEQRRNSQENLLNYDLEQINQQLNQIKNQLETLQQNISQEIQKKNTSESIYVGTNSQQIVSQLTSIQKLFKKILEQTAKGYLLDDKIKSQVYSQQYNSDINNYSTQIENQT